jgi:DtxR family Mn-dependent transcriptional regulator
MLEMLNHYKIRIGTKLKINKRFVFDGSVEIKVFKQAALTISAQAAENIFVHHE